MLASVSRKCNSSFLLSPSRSKGRGVGKGMKTQKDQKGTPDPLSLKAIHASAPPPSELALRKKESYSPGFAPSNDAEDTTAVPVSTAVPGRVMNGDSLQAQ